MKRIFSLVIAAMMAMMVFTGCSSQKKEYKVLQDSMADENYGIGFRKGDQALRDEVEKVLVDMKKDGKFSEISKKWFNKDVCTLPDQFTPSGATDDSLTKVKQKGKFILGLDDAFPPMGFRDKDQNIVGFDIDLATEVCSRMGVKLESRPINWDAKEAELSGGKIDCIWNGFSITDDRQKELNMTDPYMKNRQVVVTLKNSSVQNLNDLKGKVVTIQGGSSAAIALDSKPDFKASLKQVAEVKDNVLALNDLGKKNGCDAVLMDEVVANYYVFHQDKLKEHTEEQQ